MQQAAAPTPQNPLGHVSRFVAHLTGLYRDIVAERDPARVALLDKKISLQDTDNLTDATPAGNNAGDQTRRAAKQARMDAYIAFWDSLPEEDQLWLACHDARINHLGRLARIMGTTDIVQAHNSLSANTAGSIDYVIAQLRAQGVTAEQVQKFIDENAVAWFSLTGHPTNPATLEYTVAQTAVAKVLADRNATANALKHALNTLYDTPIVGPHKTPLQEAEETLNTLDVIYDSALAHKKLIEDALDKHGYAAEGVRIKTPLIRPCVWTLGDGDGNANMTAAVLADGIALHRRRVGARHAAFLDTLIGSANNAPAALSKLARACRAGTAKVEDIRTTLAAIDTETNDPTLRTQLAEFSYLLDCFGMGFGKIDIRHNADDIMETVTALFDMTHMMDAARFTAMPLDEKVIIFSTWLKDEEVIKTLSAIDSAALNNDTARRIVDRLRIIGRNPDLCEKLIVAETTHPAHALAAMLLLKITDNAVASPDSRIDLTVLSESVTDLMNIGTMLSTLLADDTFRAHVAARKNLLVMIAKSDTTRRDGRGEAEYAQYEAAVDIYRTASNMKRKYPELAPVRVSIKNGGGHALQRGGGRITELAAVHGRAAADARVTDMGPSTLTIQGQQQQILFCPGKTALGTLESFCAQNLYSKAGIQGEMPPPRFSQNINRQYAQADAWLYAQRAGTAFDALVQNNPAVDELLVAAPWLAMKAGNVSSRPAKRGEAPVAPGVTPAQAKGDNPRALQGRAISGERLTAHACLPVFSVLGLLEGMEAVKHNGAACMNPGKYGDALHHLYRAHKIHRDAARATANAVAMADFDIAWPLLTGQPRPSRHRVEKLASRFADHGNTPDITLAYLEQYFLNVERRTYEMISGQKAKPSLRHGDALRILWPDLAAQVAQRNRVAEFARVIECYRTRTFDAAPDTPLSETAYRITQALYTAANVINAPVGILATRTRLEPVQEIGRHGKTRFMRPESYSESRVAPLLSLPQSLEN